MLKSNLTTYCKLYTTLKYKTHFIYYFKYMDKKNMKKHTRNYRFSSNYISDLKI